VATVDKNFRVKNGLVVAAEGNFGGTVVVATPTQNTHATTKAYVDALIANPTMPSGTTAPATPGNGSLWFDTLTERVNVYYGDQWIAIATLEDAETLQDHIHDTSIDGSGLIVSKFISGGSYNEPGVLISAGLYNTVNFEATYDGGSATDNFN
jgi:hypothetical protein